MDLQSISKVLESENLDSRQKEDLILSIIAKDKKAIPMVMDMLDYERSQKEELINDLNLNLGRADCFLEDNIPEKDFVIKEIKGLYEKWRGVIIHLFNKYH